MAYRAEASGGAPRQERVLLTERERQPPVRRWQPAACARAPAPAPVATRARFLAGLLHQLLS